MAQGVRKTIVNGEAYCAGCKSWKHATLFYDDNRTWLGIRCRCKACDVAGTNSRISSHSDTALKNLINRMKCNSTKASERRKGFYSASEVDLAFAKELWERQGGLCAVTGVKMTHIQGKGNRIWTNVTIDRIDNDIGYLKPNVRLVCRAVNLMKSAMSDTEMLEWAALILNGPVARSILDTDTPAPQEN